MKKSYLRPKWWLLYLSSTLVFGLFWFEIKMPLTESGHTWVEAGLVLILFGQALAWLKANEAALLSEEQERYQKKSHPNTFDSSLLKPANAISRNGNGRPHNPEFHLAGRMSPAWLISLSAIIINLFKTQD